MRQGLAVDGVSVDAFGEGTEVLGIDNLTSDVIDVDSGFASLAKVSSMVALLTAGLG